jgi:hypothetical protein
LRPEHGLFLRAACSAVAAVDIINTKGEEKCVLHGSMIEINIYSLGSGGVAEDLLADNEPCFVDNHHHLLGARQVPLRNEKEGFCLGQAWNGG